MYREFASATPHQLLAPSLPAFPSRSNSFPFCFLASSWHESRATCRHKSFRIRSYKNTGGVHESVWQLCCLGEFLVISMIHLHSSEVVARGGLDFLCAGYFQWGLSRHMRVRVNAVVARANSAATFLTPRIRNLRIPRCSFKIPLHASPSRFRRPINRLP